MPEQETIKTNRSGGRHDSCISNLRGARGQAHTQLFSIQTSGRESRYCYEKSKSRKIM